MYRIFVLLTLTAFAAASAHSASLWDKTKSAAGSAAGVVGSTVQGLGSTIAGDEEDPAELRAKIDQAASEAIKQLTAQSPAARERYENAVGYAVFDTRKLSLLITTGFGSGVAVDKDSGKRLYMKMATGGVNIGYGVQSYQVVFLFPDHASFSEFMKSGWDADAEAAAAANEDSADAGMQLKNGVSVYKLGEKGVVLSATLTGTKYWKDDDLN